MSQKLKITILVIINVLIAAWAFRAFLGDPNGYMFYNKFDGLKNHYTYLFYEQSESKELLHFTGMNYPYGELVLYTDNSPLVAIPIKFLGNHIAFIRHNAQAIYTLLIIFNIIVAVIIAYLIISRFSAAYIVSAVCASVLVWVSPQVGRINAGHYSLTFISLTLLVIYLTIRAWELRSEHKKFYAINLLLLLACYASFFLHGYYLFLYGFWVGYFLLIGAFIHKCYRLGMAAIFIPFASVLLCFATLKGIDAELPNRGDNVIGYGFPPWASRLECLIAAPGQFTLQFFNPTGYVSNYETAGYLGNAVLFGIPIVLIALLAYRKNVQPLLPAKKLIWALAGASVLMLFIAFGEKYFYGNSGLSYDNILNPVFYLRKVFPKFQHIRCPARFQWFIYIAAYLLLAFLINHLLLKSKNSTPAILVTALVCGMGLLDIYDSVKPFSGYTWDHSNRFANQISKPDISNQNYSAILTIPFYHAGSTDVNYTLETDGDFIDHAMELSIQTGLPLFACKLSRTPEYQSQALINMFAYGSIDTRLKQKLSGKKILVMQSNLVYKDILSTQKPTYEPAYTAFAKGEEIVTRFNMDTLGTFGDFTYYKWEP